MHCTADIAFRHDFSADVPGFFRRVFDWVGTRLNSAQNTFEILEGGGSIAIAPRPEDADAIQPRSTPVVQLLNATPFKITSVNVEGMAVAENVAPFETATSPDLVLGLHQAPNPQFISGYIQRAITVNFDASDSFTLSLNLSTAGAASTELLFYVVRRGIFVTNQTGDLRAVAWVT